MTLNAESKAFVRKLEGYRSTAYALGDGVYTIGYGNTFYENNSRVKAGDTITKTAAINLYNTIVDRFTKQVLNSLGNDVTLNQNQLAALVSYAYNRGIGAFNATILRNKVQADPKDSSIPSQIIKEWGSNVAFKNSLIIRRKKEALLYSKPDLLGDVISYLPIIIIGGIILYGVFKNENRTQNEV
jgi:lysozyme